MGVIVWVWVMTEMILHLLDNINPIPPLIEGIIFAVSDLYMIGLICRP